MTYQGQRRRRQATYYRMTTLYISILAVLTIALFIKGATS